MHEITGDREVVLKVLQDTIQHLQQNPPKAKKAGMKTLGVKSAVHWPAQRDQIVEKLQQAYDRAQEEPIIKQAKTAKAIPDRLSDERWYAPRDQTIALLQSAMDEYLEKQAVKAHRAAKKAGAKTAAVPKAIMAKEAKGVASFISANYPMDKFEALVTAKKNELLTQNYSRYARFELDTLTNYAVRMVGADISQQAPILSPFEKFSTTDPRWIEVALEKLKLVFKGKAKFITHRSITDFRLPLPTKAKIAIVGDWGGGNEAAQLVAQQIKARQPDYVIHLGDVYYAGTEKEVKDRFLKFWPTPPGRSFALNSNHEMYSGGHAYFNITLKQFKQPASYFSLENKDWRFIGLDTGYVEHNLNKEQVDWLSAQLATGSAKNLLMTHHQLFSAYEGGGEHLEEWLKPFLDAGKITGWFWGHEHRLVVYKPFMNIKARCVGNGCFPYDLPGNPANPNVPVEFVDRRPQPDQQGIHSFALLSVDGPQLHVDYIDQDGIVAFQEDF